MKNILNFLVFILCCTISYAQQTPAPPQSEAIAIRGGTIHVGNGQVFKNGLIIFENGKLQTVTSMDNLPPVNWNNYKVIEATGKDIYPGFIAPNTQIGLTEIGAVNATNDRYEFGHLNPSIRSIIAYNTDSDVTPTIRSNGVLLAQIVPEGGRIAGQSSVVELDAWNWEDAAYKTDEGVFLDWPSLFSWSGWWSGNPEMKKDEEYGEKVQEIKDYFLLAQAYAQKENPETTNLKLEAMRGLFDGSKRLYIEESSVKGIMEAVLLFKSFGITPVIVGGAEAWQITDFIKENKIPIILSSTQSLPRREDSDIDRPFKKAKQFEEAGILYAFSMNGSWQQRNLAFQAGQAVAFGLEYEKAIQGLTLNTAKILGIDKQVGSLENGKDATFFISEGDALDMRTCKLTHAFIEGKAIDIDNKQYALYRKFSNKYRKQK